MLVAGWDGGGTGTTVVVMESAKEIARAHFGALNLNGTEEQTVRQTVTACVQWMQAQGECDALCIGAAGMSNHRVNSLLRQVLAETGYQGKLLLTGDQEVALQGAVGSSGAVLIAGTGSICCGKDPNGTLLRVGGGGHLLDDEGSGYAIARDMFTAVLRSMDGRAEPTLLQAMMAERIGSADRSAIISYVYAPQRTKAEIASFATMLDPAVDAGDRIAMTIAEKAANELTLLVATLVRQLACHPVETAIMGSVGQCCHAVRERLLTNLQRDTRVQVIQPRHDAAFGAATLAHQLINA